MLKAAKKEFACNGSMVDDDEYGAPFAGSDPSFNDCADAFTSRTGQVIQLQGDQRIKIQQLLVEEGIRQSLCYIAKGFAAKLNCSLVLTAESSVKLHGF